MHTEALIDQMKERARNLYVTRQLLCTEAIVVALNRGLGGGLTDKQAVALAAPFCMGLGESGCLCGALSGAVMVTGLFIGDDHPGRRRNQMRESARQLHDAFKAHNGATCCRVLSKKVKHDPNAHFLHCAELTAHAAELAASLILKNRPELSERMDTGYICNRQSKSGGILVRLLQFFS